MKVRIAIAAVIITLVIIFGISLYTASKPQPETKSKEKTTISTLTTTTTTEKAQQTTKKDNTSQNSNSYTNTNKSDISNNSLFANKNSSYINFTPDKFKSTQGDRIIFFYKDQDDMSNQVDKALTNNSNQLKSSVTVFKADYDTYKELAESIGVAQPGTLVRFNTAMQVNGLFVASYKPTIDQIKNALDI